MMTREQALTATFNELTDELAAACWDSSQQTREEALEAVLLLIAESQEPISVNVQSHLYILEGPANCGNVFGFYREGFVPANRFVVVENGEYANGGYGPCVRIGVAFETREEAETALSRLEALYTEE